MTTDSQRIPVFRFERLSRRRRGSVVLLAVVLVFVAGTVPAFQVTPLNIELTAQGAGRIESITVENTNPDPIAVQIRTYTREVLPDGTERNEPLDGVFRIYPSQMILQPGQTQVVRVQYTGPETVAVEQAYRLEARQLPINIANRDEDLGTGVRIVLRYWATLYVGPAGATPNLTYRLRNYDAAAGTGEIVVENRGTGHANLIGHTIVLSADGRTQRLPLRELPEEYSASLPAGFARVIPVEGVLQFEPQEFDLIRD